MVNYGVAKWSRIFYKWQDIIYFFFAHTFILLRVCLLIFANKVSYTYNGVSKSHFNRSSDFWPSRWVLVNSLYLNISHSAMVATYYFYYSGLISSRNLAFNREDERLFTNQSEVLKRNTDLNPCVVRVE